MLILDERLGFRSFSKCSEFGRGSALICSFLTTSFASTVRLSMTVLSSMSTSAVSSTFWSFFAGVLLSNSLSIASLAASWGSNSSSGVGAAFVLGGGVGDLRVFLGTFGENSDRVEFFLLNFSPDLALSFLSFFSSSSFLIKAFATLIGFRPNFGDICDSFDSLDASFDFFSVMAAFSGTFGGALAALLVVVAVVVDGSMEADGCVVGMEEFSFGAELVEVVRCGGGGGFDAPGGDGAAVAAVAAIGSAGMHAFAVESLVVLLNLARLALGLSPFATLLSIIFCTFCVVEGCGGGGGAGRDFSSDALSPTPTVDRRPLTDTYFNFVPAGCCPFSDFAFVADCCFCGRKLGGRILVVSTDRTAFPRVLSVVDAPFCRCRDFILELTSESPF